MVIVHTSGSTSAPKGVIHDHGPLVRHLENLNALRQLAAGVKLFSNSPMFWIGGLAYNVLGTLVAGATLVCPTSADAREALDFVERERPELVNGFAQSIANLMADPTFASRDFSSIRSGNLYPIMPEDVRPRDPELRHNMLGMTEAGSVCLMDPDESDQPEHRRGSFGRPVPELEARVVGSGHARGATAPANPESCWLRGPLLMEGYYGRERWTTFTPDEWYRTGDALPPRRRGLPLLPRAARRHDQDRWGERVAARGRGRAARRHGRSAVDRVRPPRRRARRDRRRSRRRPTRTFLSTSTRCVTPSAPRLSAYKVPRRIVRFTPAELPDAVERQARHAPTRRGGR